MRSPAGLLLCLSFLVFAFVSVFPVQFVFADNSSLYSPTLSSQISPPNQPTYWVQSVMLDVTFSCHLSTRWRRSGHCRLNDSVNGFDLQLATTAKVGGICRIIDRLYLALSILQPLPRPANSRLFPKISVSPSMLLQLTTNDITDFTTLSAGFTTLEF